jgi:hypothetical protein
MLGKGIWKKITTCHWWQSLGMVEQAAFSVDGWPVQKVLLAGGIRVGTLKVLQERGSLNGVCSRVTRFDSSVGCGAVFGQGMPAHREDSGRARLLSNMMTLAADAPSGTGRAGLVFNPRGSIQHWNANLGLGGCWKNCNGSSTWLDADLMVLTLCRDASFCLDLPSTRDSSCDACALTKLTN